MSAWVKQLASQVKKHGKAKASWYAVWKEPTGGQQMKSFGRGNDAKRKAKLFADEVKYAIKAGKYESDKPNRTTWAEFVERYDKQHLSNLKGRTAVMTSLVPFAKHLKLNKKPVSYITAERIDRFVALRRKDRGMKPGSLVTAATINRDLRHVRAALRKAKKWGYLKDVPEITMLREPKRRKNFITEDHFTDIYKSCDVAQSSVIAGYSPAHWWRGLLTFGYMTGWRIGEMLSLVWDDVSLDNGYAITRAKDNKGGRDESVYLHPMAPLRRRYVT